MTDPVAVPPLPRVWRPRRTRLVTVPAIVLVVVGSCLLAALLPPQWSVGDRVGITAIGMVVASVLLLLARPVVRADRAGVLVVNMATRRRLEWSEILRVGLGRDDSWALLDLADGTTLPVMALQAADGARGRRGVAELAALVTAYGEARP